MSEPQPTASVVVLTYNARAHIERCLAAVLAQTYPTFEVIVVDNASSDGSAELVAQQFPRVKLVRSRKNCGYGAGNNLGAAHASGEMLVFLNPDAVPEPAWLATLLSCMRAHARQFATSKITLASDPRRLNSSGNLIHYLGLSFCRGLRASSDCFQQVELVPGASGAAFAISRELFTRLGEFDPGLFMYHDDVDLSLRALIAGEQCLYVPQAIVEHDYRLVLPAHKWGWIEGHRYAVLLKTFTWPTLLVLLPALLAMDIVTLVYLALRGPAFVGAKLGSYAWLVRNAGAILGQRQRVQRVRTLSDRQVLSLLVDQIPYEQLGPGWLARLAHLLVDPLFGLYRRITLAVVHW